MKKFRFRFESLLRFRKSRRDQCCQILSKLFADLEKLRLDKRKTIGHRLDQLSELRDLSGKGKLDVDRVTSRRFHAGQLLADIESIEQQQDMLDGQIEMCRKVLTEAEREVKVIEKLREKHQADFVENRERLERIELEQTWLGSKSGEYAR